MDFNRDVSRVPWDILNTVDDLNGNIDVFNTLFGQVVEYHAPIKDTSFKHKGNPWITPAIKETMIIRDQLLKKFKTQNLIATG